MPSPNKPRALLVISQNWTSLCRLPRLFRRAGFHVTVFAHPSFEITATRYIDQLLPAPLATAQWVDALRAVLSAHRTDYALTYLCDESAVNRLAPYAGEPWIKDLYPVPPAAIEIVTSKSAFITAGQRAGLPMPDSRLCVTLAEVEEAARLFGFPIMLKANTGFAGDTVRRVDSAGAIAENLQAVLKLAHSSNFQWSGSPPVIAQRFIHGPVGMCEILYDHGTPRAWIASSKTQTHPGPFGPSCARNFFHHRDFEPIIRRLGALTQFHGLAGCDWILDPSNRVLVLEFHARATGGYHLGPKVGVDFAAGLAAIFRGEPRTQSPNLSAQASRKVYLFPQHIRRCIKEHDWRDLRHWLLILNRTDFPWADPRLVWRLTVQDFFKKLRARRSPKFLAPSLPPALASPNLHPLPAENEPLQTKVLK